MFLFAEASQDFPAVETREHDVENDSIVVIGFGFEEAGIAGFGGIDGVAFFAQGFGKVAEQARFVFDNKDSHFQWAEPNSLVRVQPEGIVPRIGLSCD